MHADTTLLDAHTRITNLMAEKAAIDARITTEKKAVRALMEAEHEDVIDYQDKALFRLTMAERTVIDKTKIPEDILTAATGTVVDIKFLVLKPAVKKEN